MNILRELGLDQLDSADRRIVAEALLDGLDREAADCPLLESQKIGLERRLADSIARPEAVTPWESIKARAMARARR